MIHFVNFLRFGAVLNYQTPESWSLVFRIAAGVHLFGITFYAIFASGELQYWAEPNVEEQKVWSPTTAGQQKETTFVRPSIYVLIIIFLRL